LLKSANVSLSYEKITLAQLFWGYDVFPFTDIQVGDTSVIRSSCSDS